MLCRQVEMAEEKVKIHGMLTGAFDFRIEAFSIKVEVREVWIRAFGRSTEVFD